MKNLNDLMGKIVSSRLTFSYYAKARHQQTHRKRFFVGQVVLGKYNESIKREHAPILILWTPVTEKKSAPMLTITEGRTSFIIAHRLTTIRDRDCSFYSRQKDRRAGHSP